MFAPDDVLVLHPQTKLKQWQEQGVLFHPPSNATLLLSPLLIDALTLMSTPASLKEVVSKICQSHKDLTSEEQLAIYDSLEQGISSLLIDGIVTIERSPELPEG